MAADVEAFFHGPTQSFTYLVSDPATGAAAVLDPVLDYDARRVRIAADFIGGVLAAAQARGLQLAWILETHVHADHLSAGDWLRRQTGAPLAIGSGVRQVQQTFIPAFGASDMRPDGADFDRLVEDGERLPLGAMQIEVLATPGHTPACVSYRIGEAVFVGDTLFMPDLGTARCDFPGGDAARLYGSLRRILALEPETRIFVCHDYPGAGRPEPRCQTSVAEQRAANIHVKDGIDQAAYVALRTARDATLDAPALIGPALQVNIRGGRLPPADADGRVRLRLPVGLF